MENVMHLLILFILLEHFYSGLKFKFLYLDFERTHTHACWVLLIRRFKRFIRETWRIFFAQKLFCIWMFVFLIAWIKRCFIHIHFWMLFQVNDVNVSPFLNFQKVFIEFWALRTFFWHYSFYLCFEWKLLSFNPKRKWK